uniref:cadherin EGF LAG seven-pass G-type receptor 2 isoform X3 n=1 Tax=Myxine glutinosa TaxID=7769 RepID=UPI00358EE5FD
MGAAAAPWIFFLPSLLALGTSPLLCADRCHSGGSFLFNASLRGPGWTYSVEGARSRHEAADLLSVGVRSGLVSVVSTRSFPAHGGLLVAVRARRPGFRALFPLRVRRPQDGPPSCRPVCANMPPRPASRLAVSLPPRDGSQCVSAGSYLVDLRDLWPESLTAGRWELRRQDGRFLEDLASKGVLRAARFLCLPLQVALVAHHPDGSLEFPVHVALRWALAAATQTGDERIERPRLVRAAATYPRFEKSIYLEKVPENDPSGAMVIQLLAGPASSGIEYTMSASMDTRSNDMFMINNVTGVVSTRQVLDRESMDQHQFIVLGTDRRRRKASCTLLIDVQDRNDHTPQFKEKEYHGSISENPYEGQPLLQVLATDQDTDLNARIHYRIVSEEGGMHKMFRLDETTGQLTAAAVLDREEAERYRLVLEARDEGRDPGPQSSTVVVSIVVLDENDNAPQFSEDRYRVSVPEDVGIPNTVLTVSATDADKGDNAKLQFSIISGNGARQFSIDPNTGEIQVVSPLDFEIEKDYVLNIRVQDNGRPHRSSKSVVTIKVDDVNDNPPLLNPYFESTVYEDMPIGHSVHEIHATDLDSGENSRLTYSFSNVPPRLPFAINDVTGLVTVASELDRELSDRYEVTVVVQDHGKRSLNSSAIVGITVRDVNDNEPKFTRDTYDVRLNEDAAVGTSVLTVTATDQDLNNIVTYEIISGNTRSRFTMNSKSGFISLTRPLDYKQERRYSLTVRASDSKLWSKAYVHVNVTDANTHRPVFQSSHYSVSIGEDQPVGSLVVVISATDEDIGDNARITYLMEDNTPQFKIDPDTGAVNTLLPLDYEYQNGYTLAITAKDNGIPQKSDTTFVDILLTDVNDNSPEFLQNEYYASVGEDAPLKTSIVRVSAKDKDSKINGQIYYTFQSGNDGNGDFEIDTLSGLIRTARRLDRETIWLYNLTAYAEDRGTPPRKTPVKVIVTVSDVNDNPPVFHADEFDIFIEENSPVGSVVARVTAVDPDEGRNAIVNYQIVEGNIPEAFQMDIYSGELTALTDLDYESQSQYTIVVQATSAPLVSRATVNIRLIDKNDNSPVLENFEIIFNNYMTNKSNSFPSGIIGRVPGYDPDVSDQLLYTFEEGNDLLILNNRTGDLRLSGNLDSNHQRLVTLTVFITDGLHSASAKCTLRVIIVTDKMLSNSITVRLKNMSQELFLSPLLGQFVDGVAAILSARKDDVFVFSIRNDTDVSAHILNVSFSARLPGGFRDEFFSSEDLQEQVYLNRTLLTFVSKQRVLPFDDNICLREPCENYMKCVSVQRFDSSAPFIASATILFRPIHPVNGLRCRCPPGFTGDYCQTEVNLCYSNPCGNSGECLRREGGFTCRCHEHYTGDYCEVNKLSGRCQPGVCRNGGTCVNVIPGGFRCSCLGREYEHPFCELTTRSFPGASFVTFKGLRQRFRMDITLTFASMSKDGLLLYNGRFNEKHDFIALEIIDGQVQLTFSAGEEATAVSPFVPGGVSDGQWHTVRVQYYNKPNVGKEGLVRGPSEEKVAVVSVDDCDTAIAIKFGHTIGNYSCAAQGHQTGSKKSLDLTGPLLLGGVPDLPETFPIRSHGFTGCLRDLLIDGRRVDLTSYIANNGTLPGCAARRDFCHQSPCVHGGTCINQWRSYRCLCPLGYGGKNCSLVMVQPLHFMGSTTAAWDLSKEVMLLPWRVGLMFRTRQARGSLFQARIGAHGELTLELSAGAVSVRLSAGQGAVWGVQLTGHTGDGAWHSIELEMHARNGGKGTSLLTSLDYGLKQEKADVEWELVGQPLGEVHLGGILGHGNVVKKGFHGCMQGARMGTGKNSPGLLPLEKELLKMVQNDCVLPDPCESNPCPSNSYCSDDWGSHSCICEAGNFSQGYYGHGCQDACQLNPCENHSTCRRKLSSSHGYICECSESHYGQYCENRADQPCPSGWWGKPMCGPCHCNTSRGFDPNCNKMTGQCNCKEHHYHPNGSEECLPCTCYPLGSLARTCDNETGQCPCKPGVIGRQCNLCDNPFAEVTQSGCEIMYNECPLTMASDIWWPKTEFGKPAAVHCPKSSLGMALRHCDEKRGWLSPDLFNCTSVTFTSLKEILDKLEKNETQMSSRLARTVAAMLQNATRQTTRLFGNDVKVAYRLSLHILTYEAARDGFGLAATQDVRFTENLLEAGSALLDPINKAHWDVIQQVDGGTFLLHHHLARYADTLARNMRATYLPPFAVSTPNIVLSIEHINRHNVTSPQLPRYDGPLFRGHKFGDTDTSVFVTDAIFQPPLNPYGSWEDQPLDYDVMAAGEQMGVDSSRKKRHHDSHPAQAVATVLVYRSLGQLLPPHYDSDRRNLRLPKRPVINSAVLSVSAHSEEPLTLRHLATPIIIHFRLLQTRNRSKPICVSWNQSLLHGSWSARGCEVLERNGSHLSCRCSQLSTFAVLMDMSNRELENEVTLMIVMYATLGTSLVFLVATFLITSALRSLRSNRSSIHKNLLLATFLTELVFLLGIHQTDNQFACTVIAILLHYFFMCCFTWLLVEGLHIYRMLAELRNINHGHMRFYYAIGWGFPAIITGLAVGLDPEGYGNPDFCWLSIQDTLIWSFAGPIGCAVLTNLVLIGLSTRQSCAASRRGMKTFVAVTEIRVAFFLLLLLTVTWLTGLLAVNNHVLLLHYLFVICAALLGICMFIAFCLLEREVREAWHTCCHRKKRQMEDTGVTTKTSLLSRSLPYSGGALFEDGAPQRVNIGTSTLSSVSTARSAKSRNSHADHLRDDGCLTHNVVPHVGPTDLDGSAFNSLKGNPNADQDSDTDSDLSLDEERSLSLASTHSSDSDEDGPFPLDPCWDPPGSRREPPNLLHSTPKGAEYELGHVKPYWPGEFTTTASDSEGRASADRLQVETRVNIEHNREAAGSREDVTPTGGVRLNGDDLSTREMGSTCQPPVTQGEIRKGILKNRIPYPPTIPEGDEARSSLNQLSRETSGIKPPGSASRAPSAGSSEGSRTGTGRSSKFSSRSNSRERRNGISLIPLALTSPAHEDSSDSEVPRPSGAAQSLKGS